MIGSLESSSRDNFISADARSASTKRAGPNVSGVDTEASRVAAFALFTGSLFHFSRSAALAEQIGFGGTNQNLRAALIGIVLVTAHHDGRGGARFFHEEAGGGCNLVRDCDDGVMQFAAAQIG